MTVITTRVVVAEDGSVSLSEPVPAGEYVARLEAKSRLVVINGAELPSFPGNPWPAGRHDRHHVYGDDET